MYKNSSILSHEPYKTNVETTQSHERGFEAKLSDDVGEELVKGEADGADHEAVVGREDEDPACGEAVVGHAAGVAPEVLDASDGVERAQRGRDERVLEAAEEEHRDHGRQKLQRVLVRSLHAVERLGVLVAFLLARVHRRALHIEPPASRPDLRNDQPSAPTTSTHHTQASTLTITHRKRHSLSHEDVGEERSQHPAVARNRFERHSCSETLTNPSQTPTRCDSVCLQPRRDQAFVSARCG
jgi:hypothetical protein